VGPRALALGVLAVAALAAAAGGIACESVLGVDFGSQRLSTCTPASPPASGGSGDTGSAVSFTAIVSSVDWGDTDDDAGRARALSIGFDLDGRCTSQFDRAPCEPAAWTGTTITDGTNGIDNAVGLLLHDQVNAFGLAPFTSVFLTQNIQNGSQGAPAMFRVTGYSGLSDDGVVTVEWLVPVAHVTPPKWDGTDSYQIAPGTADAIDGGGVVSRYVDDAAYVQDSHLVAHFPSGPPIVISNTLVKTTDALMTAQMVEFSTGHFVLRNGTLAGHGTLSELFRDLPALSSSFIGAPTDGGMPLAICTNTPGVYAKVKTWICAHADSTSGPATCDTASFGLNFDTQLVGSLSLEPPQPPITYCLPGTDPATDSCASPPPAM
jgi:hypothetical protein